MATEDRRREITRLENLEAAFEEAGGRGVELAEEIDQLRATLHFDDSLRGCSPEEEWGTSEQEIDIYIETERPAKFDSRGVALVRNRDVLVVGDRRYNFGGHTGQAAAEIAQAAVRYAVRSGCVDPRPLPKATSEEHCE